MSRHDLSLLNASIAYGGIRDLSPYSIALCVMALGTLTNRYLWHDGGFLLDDNQWNDLDYKISSALDEIMGGLVGVIVPAVFETVINLNLLPCDGSLYERDDYPQLYDVLDLQFIVNSTQFRTPDLRRRVVASSGSGWNLGDTGGAETVTLDISEIPSHSHSYNQYTFGVDIITAGVPDPTGVGQPALPQSTSSAGGGGAHENMPPYFVLDWYIISS